MGVSAGCSLRIPSFLVYSHGIMSSEKSKLPDQASPANAEPQRVSINKAPWSSPELKDLGDVVEETKLGFGGSSDGPGQS